MGGEGRKFDSQSGRVAGSKSKKHGAGAVQARGVASLDTPEERMTYKEIKEGLRTQRDIVPLLRELAARHSLSLDRLDRYYAGIADEEGTGAVLKEGSIRFYLTLAAELRRTLESLAKHLPPGEESPYADELERVGEVIEAQVEGSDEKVS